MDGKPFFVEARGGTLRAELVGRLYPMTDMLGILFSNTGAVPLSRGVVLVSRDILSAVGGV